VPSEVRKTISVKVPPMSMPNRMSVIEIRSQVDPR
jgi:hypothetical protein